MHSQLDYYFYTSMWAWFKHDEGAGTIIKDYSPNYTNGTLTGSTTKFWSVPGFGHSDTSSPYTYTSRSKGPWPVLYNSTLVFVRPINTTTTNSWCRCFLIGQGGSANWVHFGWKKAEAKWAILTSYNDPVVYSVATFTVNNWYCLFVQSAYGATGYVKMYVRASGGAFTQVFDLGNGSVGTGDQNMIYLFDYSYGSNCDMGEIMVWAAANPTGVIPLDMANAIYDTYKGRHGMT